MVRILELIGLRFAAVLACAALVGCSSSGSSEMLSAARDSLSSIGRTDSAAAEPDLATNITRAQIEQLGVALIRVQEPRAPDPSLLVAFRKTGQQVIYVLRAERRLILHGGLIQATYGFGDNLEPIAVGRNDPVAYPRPLAEWPNEVTRQYTVSSRGPGTPVAVTCLYRRGASGPIEIVELTHVVQTVTETCSGDGIEFSNRYDVAPATGVIWRSIQWTGPAQGSLIYEVLEPLD